MDSKATKRLCGSELVYVSEEVFLEAAWILFGKQYQFTVREIAVTLEPLFQEPNFWFVDTQEIWQAISE